MLATATRTEPTSPAQTGAIDTAYIADLIEAIGSDDYRALIETFKIDTQEQMAALETGASRRDVDAMKRSAHRLAGLFAQFGAFEVARSAELIRTPSDADELEPLAQEMLRLCRLSAAAIEKSQGRD